MACFYLKDMPVGASETVTEYINDANAIDTIGNSIRFKEYMPEELPNISQINIRIKCPFCIQKYVYLKGGI